MRARPVSLAALVEELADRFAATAPDGWLRVGVDGAPAAGPAELADALVGPLRLRGRPAVRIAAEDFLRPASVRLEFGRTNPDSFYAGWLDEAGLRREVLDPTGPGGSGRILTRLWDTRTDRSAREPYRDLPAGSVVLVSGPLLLGGGMPFDLAVHLTMSPAALGRRTTPELRWTLPAYARYDAEVDPASFADVVVRVDDPRHPAVLVGRP
ncbi:uridine kinase [Krasilnikovia sp. MM14-A1259]|uniref:uridine kinase n=1 Tax=Krasilnikovia sp. MM14-A1259 TaxID=3373539 RepID=UPI0038136AD6